MTGSNASSGGNPPYAIVLAGGSGTRLWPLSRTLLPKQLLALNGEKTLLQDTMSRVAALTEPGRVWIVTNEEHVFEVRSQVKALDPALEGRALAEPLARNTLPAIMLALDKIAAADPKTVAAVFPADHQIRDVAGWKAAMDKGLPLAAEGWFVTFGVTPQKPETGYGYIHRGRSLGEDAFEVEGFIEKPDLHTAENLLKSGDYFWNSGMFLFRVDMFLDAVKRYEPALWAWWEARETAPLADNYADLPDLSVDYGVVERLDRIAMVEASFDWDDLGSWEAIFRLGDKDASGCVTKGDVLAMDCANSLFISQGGKLAVTGLADMIVIQTRDATLACPLSRVQSVKDVVGALKKEGSSLVEAHVTVKRPWGSYTVLEDGPYYKIKRIEVPPQGRLSLQMHYHRSEHWVVISGTALVQVGEKEILLSPNQSVDIPVTTLHRLSNPGKTPVEIIEIQSGPYLEEDDIVRFDDVYGRIRPGKDAAEKKREEGAGEGNA